MGVRAGRRPRARAARRPQDCRVGASLPRTRRAPGAVSLPARPRPNTPNGQPPQRPEARPYVHARVGGLGVPVTTSRRAFLGTLGAGWLASAFTRERAPIGGRIVGASHGVGHLLRGAHAPTRTGPTSRADVVIVGSGIAGVAAAWRLAEAGL